MKKKFKLGVIGAGFMSSAIINGVVSSKVLPPESILVSDINQTSLQKIATIGVNTTTDNVMLATQSEFVLFAVKPQSLSVILEQINGTSVEKFISIMAGVKKQRIKQFFPNAAVARCMPNTPCSIGCGAVGVDLSDYTDKDDVDFIASLLKAFAEVVFVEEKDLNAVTGVSGSSPAYFYLFLKGIIESGVKHGLSYDDAKLLAVNTMIGAGNMVLKNQDKTLDELINAVCSKGGTTIEAINVYNDGGITKLTEKAIDACVKRASELENL